MSLRIALAMLATLACVLVGSAAPASAAARPQPASIGAPATTPAMTAMAASSSALRCASTWKSAGYPSTHAVMATAIGLAESSCTSSATNSNGPTSGCPSGSVDRGMWQINSCYHPEVSSSCAFSAICNAQAAYRISSSGSNWGQWATYTSGAYKSRLSDAQSAVNSVYGGSTSTGWPVVREGASGSTVTTLQYLLRAHGSTIAADGAFGPATDSAVRSFQSAHGLSVDGVVGTNTWSAVIITVQSGSNGDAVRAAQNALRAHGSSIALDGSFGPATDSAVRSFQSAHGLTVDGVVGPNTWRALVN